MATHGKNEGSRVIGDFVCDAIHAPGVPLASPNNLGKNEGARFLGETIIDLSVTPTSEHVDTQAEVLADRLHTVIGELPVDVRSIFVLRLNGKSFTEISQAIGVPEDDVKARFFRLIQGLQDFVP